MAHLHAFLAVDSPSAILLKRGPGKVSGTFGWDRATDTFHAGQWVRHLIRHEDADLSPDGRFFIHYSDTHLHRKDFPVYLAISRAPWLKALALWGSESWIQGPGPARFFKDLTAGRNSRAGFRSRRAGILSASTRSRRFPPRCRGTRIPRRGTTP